MTFEDAIVASIRAYYKGIEPENYLKEKGEVKYTREYFDQLEEEFLKDKKSKKKKMKESEDGRD